MKMIKKCVYGCGKEAKFQLKNGKWCCCESSNSCPAIKKKNSDGLKKAYRDGKIDAKKIYSNKSDEAKRKQAWSKGKCLLQLDDVFKENTNWATGLLKKYLLFFGIKKEVCEMCGLSEWNNKKIPLECHHIDGNSSNNSIKNLQLLCMNCHAQTENFRGKNINGNRKKYIPDEKIVEAIKNTKNIRQTLLFLGLAPKGGNYVRVKKIKNEYGL